MLPLPLLLSLPLATLAASPRGAVAAAHPLASAAGAEILREGGNAVDAAVAAAFALSVVEPQSSGVGGGGFALVYTARDRRVRVLDFREVAPAAATADMYTRPGVAKEASLDGGLAVAVPGAVKGYAELARRFGSRPLARLVEPAARIADDGFTVGRVYASRARERLACLRADAASAAEFLVKRPDGAAPPAVGDRLVRRDHAKVLRLLGKDPDAFYAGPLAVRIAAAVKARGGVLTEEDLRRYRVREREPLAGTYRGHRVFSMPPPSAGGAIVLGLLRALEPEEARAGGYRPERYLHVMIEAEKRLYAARGARLGDPDQVAEARGAAEEMASPAFAARLRAGLGDRATPADDVRAPPAPGNTSHLSVVDADGNAVALTTSVNTYFGACVTVPGTGIALDNTMDDFDRAPGVPNAFGLVGGGPNAIAPGKVPLSSMAPTFVFAPDGRLALAVGAAGGSRIPTAVAQAILHVVDDGMGIDEAIGAPRLHEQWRPDAVYVEPNGLEAATAAALGARGHKLTFLPQRGGGNAQAAAIAPDGLREAACDPRYEGAPAAP
ncbi:MAG: gamma-glutamyltransferase [Anaeromyxobacteraceae bacterium]